MCSDLDLRNDSIEMLWQGSWNSVDLLLVENRNLWWNTKENSSVYIGLI